MISVTNSPPIIPQSSKPAHHVGSPPTSFVNPWPSFNTSQVTLLNILRTRFARNRPAFIPVPERSELVQIRRPDWGGDQPGLKATWIGHASFLIETTKAVGAERGVRVLCDPVFSERTSPVQFFGPKRYSPTPCTLDELPDVDLVVISHDHYDHLDLATIKHIFHQRGIQVHFFAGLGNAQWFHRQGIPSEQVTELDWWDARNVDVDGIGSIRLVCTPTQHLSGRGPFDRGKTLWCSWAIIETEVDNPKKLFFAGDTGYRSVSDETSAATGDSDNSTKDLDSPICPAFAEIGSHLGPFDLALLPIGLCYPRHMMSPVHCNPWDSVDLHHDLRAKKSIGMHWGTVRGGISQQYEDVRDPPRWWRQAATEAGLDWGRDAALLDIGETAII